MSVRYVGKDIPRNDGFDKVTGRGVFTFDVHLPRMLHGKILRSPYAHAKVLSIDTSAAEALPACARCAPLKIPPPSCGTARPPCSSLRCPISRCWIRPSLPANPSTSATKWPAWPRIRRRSPAQAVKLIRVEWQQLPAVYDPLEAVKPDAPQVQPRFANPEYNNICGGPVILTFGGDPDEAFKHCDEVVEYRVKLPRVKQAQMETHGAVASYCPDGRLDVISTTQAPYPTKMILAEALDLPVSKVTVRNPPYVGGGFGVRIGLSGKAEILAAALSMKCGRPVKLIYTREEDFTCSDSRHGGYLECRLGARKDGAFVALDTRAWLNTGAYATFGTDLVGVCGACGTAGAYVIPNFRYTGWPVYTNQMTAGAMRGFGSPQGNAVVEPAIELMAQRLGMDSIELRKKNSTREDTRNWFPFPPGSCGTNECLDRAAAAIQWNEKHGRGRSADRSGPQGGGDLRRYAREQRGSVLCGL